MKTSLYNLKAEVVGEVTLPKTVFETEVKPELIAQVIRAHLANSRSAFAKVKERGDVAGTTKKMWAQKGTGRARHGSAKAGIFVGGGSVHGPQGNQNFELKINKKVKKVALNSIFSQFALDKKIIVIDDLSVITPKTKEAWNFIDLLEKANSLLANSKKIGIITDGESENVTRAFGNIPGLSLISTKSLGAYEISNQNFLIFSQKSLESLK